MLSSRSSTASSRSGASTSSGPVMSDFHVLAGEPVLQCPGAGDTLGVGGAAAARAQVQLVGLPQIGLGIRRTQPGLELEQRADRSTEVAAGCQRAAVGVQLGREHPPAMGLQVLLRCPGVTGGRVEQPVHREIGAVVGFHSSRCANSCPHDRRQLVRSQACSSSGPSKRMTALPAWWSSDALGCPPLAPGRTRPPRPAPTPRPPAAPPGARPDGRRLQPIGVPQQRRPAQATGPPRKAAQARSSTRRTCASTARWYPSTATTSRHSNHDHRRNTPVRRKRGQVRWRTLRVFEGAN